MFLKLPKTGLEKCFWPLICYQSALGLANATFEDQPPRHARLLQYTIGTLHVAILAYVLYPTLTYPVSDDIIFIQLVTHVHRWTNSSMICVLAFISVFSFSEEKRLYFSYLKALDKKLPLFKNNQLLYNFLSVTSPLLAVCTFGCIQSIYSFITLDGSYMPLYLSMVHTLINTVILDAGSCMYFLSLAVGLLNIKLKQVLREKITATQAYVYKDCLSIIANAYATFEEMFRFRLSLILTIETVYLMFLMTTQIFYRFDVGMLLTTMVVIYIRLLIIGGSSEFFHVNLEETKDICYDILKNNPKGGGAGARHERIMAKNLRRISDVRLQKIQLGFSYILDVHLIFAFTMTIIRSVVIQFQFSLIFPQTMNTGKAIQ